MTIWGRFWTLCVSRSVVSNSCNSMDCSPPGSSVHGIFQARILEWVAISFSRRSSPPKDWTQFSCFAGWFFTLWAMDSGDHFSWGEAASMLVFPQTSSFLGWAIGEFNLRVVFGPPRESTRALWGRKFGQLATVAFTHVPVSRRRAHGVSKARRIAGTETEGASNL